MRNIPSLLVLLTALAAGTACAPMESAPRAGAMGSRDVVILETRDYRVHLTRPGVYTVENERGEIVGEELTTTEFQAAFPQLWQKLGGSFARLDARVDL